MNLSYFVVFGQSMQICWFVLLAVATSFAHHTFSFTFCRFVLLATRLSTMRKVSLLEGGASTRDASSAHLAGKSLFLFKQACFSSRICLDPISTEQQS